jgi:hypothetical protein
MDANMKPAYFAAIVMAHEAFAYTLWSKMIATVASSDTMAVVDQTMTAAATSTLVSNPTPPSVLSESNGTPFRVQVWPDLNVPSVKSSTNATVCITYNILILDTFQYTYLWQAKICRTHTIIN